MTAQVDTLPKGRDAKQARCASKGSAVAKRCAHPFHRYRKGRGMTPELTVIRDAFCARFKAHMIKRAGETFDDGGSIADYADETAPTYFDTEWQQCEGPEACAEADMSYWGED